MSERSISQYFEYLGAPLVNVRWSWGAIATKSHATSGTLAGEQEPHGGLPPYIVLRIWQDRCERRDGTQWAMVTHHDKYMDYDSLGWKERLDHVELIKAGIPVYCIMCRVKDPSTSPREIASFDAKTVFVGGGWEEYDGDIWVELVDRIPGGKLTS